MMASMSQTEIEKMLQEKIKKNLVVQKYLADDQQASVSIGKYLSKSKKDSKKRSHQRSLEMKLNPTHKKLAEFFQKEVKEGT